MELSKAHKALNLDANASFGLLPEVAEELRERFPSFLNPSSIHRGGQAARAVIEDSRAEIAASLGLTRAERIVFTSGATESNNTALQLPFSGTRAADSSTPTGNEIVVSSVEHPSVLEAARRLQNSGHMLQFLNPELDGTLSSRKLGDLVDSSTKVLSVMYANNETGHVPSHCWRT